MAESTLPPMPREEASRDEAGSSVRGALLWGAAATAVGWVIFLSVITIRTANPPVINRVQVDAADLLLVGRWEDRAQGQFLVERELKHGQLKGRVEVLGVPDAKFTPDEEWVIPVTKTGKAYTVTNGVFTNRPQGPRPEKNEPAWKISVPAQYYPATEDVLRQIADVLAGSAPQRKI